MRTCAIRADGGSRLGGGHLVRCLALAEELMSRGWKCILHTVDESNAILARLNKNDVPVHILGCGKDQEIEKISSLWPDGVDVMVIDHYERGDKFEMLCRSFAKIVMSIDDYPSRAHKSDLLFDPTAGRVADEYRNFVASHTRVLSGVDYALLRSPFYELREETLAMRQKRGGIQRILVSIGVSDISKINLAVLEGIEFADLDVHYDFVCGFHASNMDEIRQRLNGLRNPGNLLCGVSDIEILMISADFAIGAPGATSWERCCLGLPSILCLIADNQEGNGKTLEAVGAARVLDWRDNYDSEVLSKHLIELADNPTLVRDMSVAAASVCDGQGAVRTVNAIEAHSSDFR